MVAVDDLGSGPDHRHRASDRRTLFFRDRLAASWGIEGHDAARPES